MKSSRTAIPARRRLWFRWVAVLVVPLLVLGGLELALRIFGYGYPTSFFVPATVAGQRMWVENGRFGLRFFPKELVRRPPPTVMDVNKPSGAVRIFLLGESAALGDPHPAYGMGRYLQVLLRERYPGTQFEVISVAMTAINSHAILPIARECAGREGDVWVVYMGNNEMVGPFGAATVFGPKAPGRAMIRATLGLRSTRLGQALTDLGRAWAPVRHPSWGGMEMFLEQQVGVDDPSRGIVHGHFEANLEGLVRSGLKAGVGVVLSTVAVNLKDCAPFASAHGDQVIGQLAEDWRGHYQRGQELQLAGSWREALEAYAAAAAIDPRYAELAFREGICHEALGAHEAARHRFEAARDLDVLPFRADSAINAAVREVAAAHAGRGVRLVDADGVLSATGWIPGEESFYEHVHLTLAGNYWLARAFGAEIEPMLPERVRGTATPEWATAEICERRLGLTDWNREAVYGELMLRLSQAPFTHQLGHEARLERVRIERERLRSGLNAAHAAEALEVYQDAIRRSPGDHRLYANYAEFLTAVGRLEEAVAQWRRVESLLPHHHVAAFQLGKLRSRQGAYDEARSWLEQCLERQPGAVDAIVELGHLEARRKRPAEAIVHYRAALERQPWNGSLYLDLAEVQAAAGDRAVATESLRRAIALQPSLWRAHYYLGVELAEKEQIKEAESAFAEAARLNPGYALAHLNLGVAMIRQGRVLEAAERFQTTLRLDPENAKAREYLELLRSQLAAPAPAEE
jgi:tetratricopeptide (TPR) repeat protein